MGRWLAVDHGDIRIGLAVGDTEAVLAGPLKVIPASPLDDAVNEIARIAADYEVDGIVVGWPINMDDSVGPQADIAKAFALHLADVTGRDVRLWDERLSSFQADSALAGQLTRNKRRQRQDALAASAFLQDFLTGNGPEEASRPADL
jgi:putative holliday junction resolvase